VGIKAEAGFFRAAKKSIPINGMLLTFNHSFTADHLKNAAHKKDNHETGKRCMGLIS
jgi:hypothetical protein